MTREPRILHATSGSLAARAATVIAAELAAGFEAQLITVHVSHCRVTLATASVARDSG